MDMDRAQKITDTLLADFATTLDGTAYYHLDNNRIIQLADHTDDMDEEDLRKGKPRYSIALMCSADEWDCPNSKYYARHSPNLKYITFSDPNTNILYMVAELLMINEVTPLMINN